MNDRHLDRLAGLLLVFVPVLFNLLFGALGAAFDYPAVLRAPTDAILRRFHAGGAGLVALWYAFAVSALLLAPVALLLGRLLRRAGAPLAGLTAAVGVAAAAVQVVGLLRWSFLVPALAAAYVDPAAGEAGRAAAAVVFEAFHRFLGAAIGEHLGYFTTAIWTVLVARASRDARLAAGWWTWPGLLGAAGIAAGLFEPAGVLGASALNAAGYLVWSVWLAGLGVALLRRRGSPGLAASAAG